MAKKNTMAYKKKTMAKKNTMLNAGHMTMAKKVKTMAMKMSDAEKRAFFNAMKK